MCACVGIKQNQGENGWGFTLHVMKYRVVWYMSYRRLLLALWVYICVV